jgi:hypothetical protein
MGWGDNGVRYWYRLDNPAVRALLPPEHHELHTDIPGYDE